ncbi:hypothetical protein LMG33818_001989 [Halomonadaceae bacterium LMG 33818]|uniref:AbrB family transcriptional regulator n=1 Tax=Cernens ardua TaxID=3402176 RepID=UPI003EDBD073
MSQPLTRLPRPLRWLLLVVLCGIASQCLVYINFPGGQFIGPMLASIVLALLGISLKVERVWFNLGQGAIGILISEAFTLAVIMNIAHHWIAMLVVTVILLFISFPVGLFNVRFGGMPGTTAAWGTSPGGASVMVAMAEDNGGDPRVVATMQYVRVVCVVLTGAIVAHFLHPSSGTTSSSAATSASITHDPIMLIITLVLLAAGSLIGRKLIPAGAMLGPVIIATPLQLLGWIHLDLPLPILSIAYGLIGAYVGLRFDKPTIMYVIKAIPMMVVSSMLLIGLCAISAYVLQFFISSDYLSLYLATSPGGLDSMTIIALDTHADVGIVAALQILRMFSVVLAGPWMAKQIARFAVEKGDGHPHSQ